MLVLGDNLGLMLKRKISALLLCTGVRLHGQRIVSELDTADGPSGAREP